ncbi:sensor histidine kinase [Streptomyces sp. 6N223]|uniref:sensor histidine kinase n=1 Tax=Streptomyces sp. 6N223 TaxID=3457412 RepID=UPI003FD09A5D
MAFNRRLALRGRAGVVSGCAVLAVLAMPVAEMAPAAAFAAVAVVWSWAHLRLATASAVRPGLLLAADLTVMTALCLTQPMTIPDAQTVHGSTWILVAVDFTAVSYQLTLPARIGIPAGVWLCCADLAGTALHRPGQWTEALPIVCWVLVNITLAQVVIRLVFGESRAADEAADRAARARQQWEVEEARCAAEREHLAALHDTACATLLIASAPWSSMPPETVRAQAARDIARLRAGQTAAGEVDLTAELAEEIAGHPLRVTATFDDDLGTVWRPAAAALRGSLGEALRNVTRYAGVDAVRVSAEREQHVMVVTVSDAGVGFDPERIPTQRIGIRRSIRGRMWNVGGRGSVESAPGRGTTVRLEWPRV